MKQFSLAVALLGTLILGACSTSNEVVGGGIFHKRKYTGGVYVDRSEKKKEAKEKEVEEVNYDILSVNEEKQAKYVSSQVIRQESKSTDMNSVAAAPQEEKVKKCTVAAMTSTESAEEVEFDIYKSAAQKSKKFASTQEVRQNNTVAEIEDVYADDNTMASTDESIIPEATKATKEEETVVINDTKKKKNVKMSSKSLLGGDTILYVILAILLPPLAVGLYEGITTRFWISLLLTLLFWLPGVIYAILVVTGTI